MPYGFENLSPADFEDLVRSLVGRELSVRFEAFAAGPDGGMDGRHAGITLVHLSERRSDLERTWAQLVDGVTFRAPGKRKTTLALFRIRRMRRGANKRSQ
jgi:hypothetical protein